MNVFITGTSSGIGEALAEHYLKNGNNVYGISRRENQKLNKFDNFFFVPVDLMQLDTINTKLQLLVEKTDIFDLVVLNAGILNAIKDLKDTPLEEIKDVMDINVWSNKVLIDSLFELMRVKQVVAVSSGASVSGSRGWNAYSLSKATLNMLISLYAKEHTETHFCALAPGIIDTNMQDYISSIENDKDFPVVRKLKKAKGTEMMPSPSESASFLAKAFKEVLRFESGSFQDIRDIMG